MTKPTYYVSTTMKIAGDIAAGLIDPKKLHGKTASVREAYLQEVALDACTLAELIVQKLTPPSGE